MPLSTYDLFLVALLIVTFLFAAMAASAETALTSVSRIKLRRMVEDGDPRAKLIEKLHREPNDYLTAILTTNTLAIVISATCASLIAENLGYAAFWPQLVVSLLDALLVLVFAEITAKSLALSNMGYALRVAPVVSAITGFLRPALRLMSGFARFVSRGRGAPAGPFVTEEELKLLVTVGEEEGIIEEDEREMIHGVIELGDMTVREAMVPRIDIDAVEVHQSISEVIDLILKQGRTRIPVYEETIDHIVGVAHVKDLVRYNLNRRGGEERRNGDLRKVMRKPFFVTENKNLSEFLHDMQEQRNHMAIVIDEHGQTAGIITIEDIIEEIVGPIRDEYDHLEEEDVVFVAPADALLNAGISLDDANDELGLELDAEDVDSLGGFMYSRLGAVPKVGQRVDVEGIALTVESMRGQRIGKIRAKGEGPFPGAVRREEARVEQAERAAAADQE